MNRTLALQSGDSFGIKGEVSGGKISVRMFYEPEYHEGGKNGIALIYGVKINSDYTDRYGKQAWKIAPGKGNAPFFCDLGDNWFCRHGNASSTSYIKRLHMFFRKASEGSWNFDPNTTFSGQLVKNIPVIIEVEFTGNATLENLIDIKLPGLSRTITNTDFARTHVKGINFQIRPAATKLQLDAAGDQYNKYAVNSFNITHNYMTGDMERAYQIVIPRIPRTAAVRTDRYATNIAVYPFYNSTISKYAYYLVASSRNHISLPKGGEITDKGLLFKAMSGNKELAYSLYEVTLSTPQRVLIKNITLDGPFLADDRTIRIKRPKVSKVNLKIHEKRSLSSANRHLVAWHRGDWRTKPENTIESITAASDYDLLELDVSRAGGDYSERGVPNYVLFHDPFMFRESSTGPSDPCVDPYDKLLVPSVLLTLAKRQDLKNELKGRFPGHSATEYENWIKGPGDFTYSELRKMKVRDRFGCLSDIKIPSFREALNKARELNLAIMVDKGWSDIDGIYWHSIELDYEDNVFFKGGPARSVAKLVAQYGDELMQQIGYTPFYFDSKAQESSSFKNGQITFLEEFIQKENNAGWNVPGFELQIKMMVSDGSSEGFSPLGIQRLLNFRDKYKLTKWIGITQINPTAINGFDNKIVYMDSGENPKQANPYSSRFDRRADLDFNLNYLKCDYWTSDRPDVIIDFLKALGKFSTHEKEN